MAMNDKHRIMIYGRRLMAPPLSSSRRPRARRLRSQSQEPKRQWFRYFQARMPYELVVPNVPCGNESPGFSTGASGPINRVSKALLPRTLW